MDIEVISCQTIEDLLARLDPAKNEWDKWFFRGQPDESLKLIPSIWRSDKKSLFTSFENKIDKEKFDSFFNGTNVDELSKKFITNWIMYAKFENSLLSNFYNISNRAGLKIPELDLIRSNTYNFEYWAGDRLDWYDSKGAIKNYLESKKDGHPFFSYSGGPVCFTQALPQHHGLPTRVLDWTRDPRKAIFFATYYNLINNQYENVKSIAIYAYKAKKNGPLQIFDTYSRYENTFLHAQDALFTLINGDFYYLENGGLAIC